MMQKFGFRLCVCVFLPHSAHFCFPSRIGLSRVIFVLVFGTWRLKERRIDKISCSRTLPRRSMRPFCHRLVYRLAVHSRRSPLYCVEYFSQGPFSLDYESLMECFNFEVSISTMNDLDWENKWKKGEGKRREK